MFTGSAFKPALTVKSDKSQMQPTSYKVGISSLGGGGGYNYFSKFLLSVITTLFFILLK